MGAGQSIGVVGTVTGLSNVAVHGINETSGSYGFMGVSGSGVQGYGGSQNVGAGGSIGVYGFAQGTANVGVYGQNASGFGGYFAGNVYVTGNLGLGGYPPSPATARLDVLGRMRVGSDASGADTGTGTVIWNTAGGDTGFAGYHQIFYTGANSSRTERMRIDNNGNIGIGTSNPIAPLHVSGTANIGVIGTNETTNSFGYLGRQYYGVHGVGPTDGVGAGESIGVVGSVTGSANIGVYGFNETTNSTGYLGRQYYGVHGIGPTDGVGAGESIGVVGSVTGSANIGVYGFNETTASYGYIGISGSGVQGHGGTQNVGAGNSVGVYGQASGTGNIGVYGSNESGFGGYFAGNVYVTGNITVAGRITGSTVITEGAVGTHAFCYIDNGASAVTFGTSVSGSNLYPTGSSGGSTYASGTALSGTWKCLGHISYTPDAAAYYSGGEAGGDEDGGDGGEFHPAVPGGYRGSTLFARTV